MLGRVLSLGRSWQETLEDTGEGCGHAVGSYSKGNDCVETSRQKQEGPLPI
jgi:hypothetical protein